MIQSILIYSDHKNSFSFQVLSKLKYVYKDREMLDTVRDTIPKPYPVEKIVIVNELHWWQESLIWVGVVAIVILLVMLWSKTKK